MIFFTSMTNKNKGDGRNGDKVKVDKIKDGRNSKEVNSEKMIPRKTAFMISREVH